MKFLCRLDGCHIYAQVFRNKLIKMKFPHTFYIYRALEALIESQTFKIGFW